MSEKVNLYSIAKKNSLCPQFGASVEKYVSE
nr:MAG TPA: hypothetical protein [Caudoviricetes sp.]